MTRIATPLQIWCDATCFWLQVGRANIEMTLRMWEVVGRPPLASMDQSMLALWRTAARPADVPDPVPLGKRQGTGPRAAKPVAASAPKAGASAAPAGPGESRGSRSAAPDDAPVKAPTSTTPV